MFYEKGGLAAQVGLKSRTTVLDPNPRGVYVPMWFNPGKGVEGASGACAAPTALAAAEERLRVPGP
jgi:hypothetical protein